MNTDNQQGFNMNRGGFRGGYRGSRGGFRGGRGGFQGNREGFQGGYRNQERPMMNSRNTNNEGFQYVQRRPRFPRMMENQVAAVAPTPTPVVVVQQQQPPTQFKRKAIPREDREPKFMVTKNGAISIYNIQRQPVIMYAQLWEKLGNILSGEAFQNFLKENEGKLRRFEKRENENEEEVDEETEEVKEESS
jgi:hypothetical protein